ncbi:MAG: DUF4760 domain-containing protein [Pseudomonadota bacterium]
MIGELPATVFPAAAILLSTTVAVVLASWSIRAQRKIARQRAAMDFLAKSDQDGDLIKARQKFIQLARDKDGLLPWADIRCEGTIETEAVRTTLNDLELLAIGISNDIIDRAIVVAHREDMILSYFEAAQPFMAEVEGRQPGSLQLYPQFSELYRSVRAENNLRRLWHRGTATSTP